MKKAIVVVILILVIGLSIPFASGLLMERTVRSSFDDINSIYAASGTGYRLEIVSYDRGYRTSDIEWKIDLGALKAFYRIEEVVFNEHAEHGFAGVVSTTSLEKNPWYETFLAEKLQGHNPLHISTEYGILGSIQTTVELDAFSVTAEDKAIDVKAGSLVMATDHKLKNFTSSGSWEGLSAGEKLDVGKISLASNLKMFSAFIWNGDVSFDVQRITAREKDDRFNLQGLKGRYLLKVDDDQSATSWEGLFSFDGLNANDTKVDKASVRLAMNGVKVDGYEAFMQMYTQNMTQFFGNMAALGADSEAAGEVMKKQMAMIGFQMMAAYEKLLKQGLEFEVSDLHVELAEGEITGGINLRLLKDMSFMQFAPIVSQPELLFDIFYLKSDLSLPVELVGEDPKLLTPLYPGMQTGLFVRNGDNLVHQAETINGKLIVNRQEVVLSPPGSVQPASSSI